MDVDGFWAIIDGARDDEDALRAALEPLSREDLADFDGLLYAMWSRADRQDVWGARYTLDGGMSDDSFMDFRSWLISQGRAVYEAVLINPDALADAVPDLVVREYHTAEGDPPLLPARRRRHRRLVVGLRASAAPAAPAAGPHHPLPPRRVSSTTERLRPSQRPRP